MDATRRKVLLSVGVGTNTVLAGCSLSTNETTTPTESPDSLYALTGSYSIPAGEFRDLELGIDEPAEIEYTADVTTGPNIDVLVLTRGEFRKYERGNDFDVIEDASAMDTGYGDVQTPLEPADLNLVFDNTSMGAATPPNEDGTVEVDFEVAVRQHD